MTSYRRMVHHPLAVGRAKQIIRKHAWQFHGAGVEDAVRQLTRAGATGTVVVGDGSISVREIQTARDRLGLPANLPAELPITSALRRGLEKLRRDMAASVAAMDSPPVVETAHGLTVVGWQEPVSGFVCCTEHRAPGATPVTASDGPNYQDGNCAVCGRVVFP